MFDAPRLFPLLVALALTLPACRAALAQAAAAAGPSSPDRPAAGAALQAPAEPATAELSAIKVTGRAATDTHYRGEATGAKSTLPVQELPQSVRIVTRESIDDWRATRLDDVVDSVSGVSRQNDLGGLWDNIAIRGLPGNENTGPALLLNGFSANRGLNAPRDLASVERIEFLKGPAAALYGSSEPGGTLNIVSKAPLWKRAGVAEVAFGSFGHKRATLDTGGPLGEDVAYRLNVALEDENGFRDFVGTRRNVFAPAVTWRLGGDTVLDYTGEYIRHAAPFDRGVVAVDGRLGTVPRSRFLGEPADGDASVVNTTHQLALSHEWGGDWRSRFALSQRSTSLSGVSTEATALRADGLLTRQRRLRDYDSHDLAGQAELQGRVQAGGLDHELLLGAEAFRFSLDSLMLRANPTATAPYAIDIDAPVYGQPPPTPGRNTDTLERQRNLAFYAQDTVRLATDWRLMAGVRLDRYRTTLDNRNTATRTSDEPSSASPRVGLSWLPTTQWTVYANAGRSFRPNVGTDAAGEGFAPENGRALEAGAKWESADRRLGATAAVFDIRKRNVVTSDPGNAGFSVASGEVRSRGAELDLAGRLTSRVRVTASVGVTDVQVTRDNTLEIGGRLLDVPRTTASLFGFYEDVFANGRRYGVGGGLTRVGERLGQARTQVEAAAGVPAFELPAYTLARLTAFWEPSASLRLSLAVNNLFDRDYYPSSYSRVWVTPGSGRAVTVALQGRF